LGVSNLIWLRSWDRFPPDRPPALLLSFAANGHLTAYPAMAWLVDQPSSSMLMRRALAVFIIAGYNGANGRHLRKSSAVAVPNRRVLTGLQSATTIGGSTPARTTDPRNRQSSDARVHGCRWPRHIALSVVVTHSTHAKADRRPALFLSFPVASAGERDPLKLVQSDPLPDIDGRIDHFSIE